MWVGGGGEVVWCGWLRGWSQDGWFGGVRGVIGCGVGEVHGRGGGRREREGEGGRGGGVPV